VTSRERVVAAWQGRPADYVPFTTWCFGFRAPPGRLWDRDGVPRRFWYSLRMEHLHTLPQPWTLEDDFRRVRAWRELGLDDVLEVSVPWSVDRAVSYRDRTAPAGELDERYDVLVRDYETADGPLQHAIRRTGEDPGEGWVVQPDHVPLFEDYNIPRGARHAVAGPADVSKVGHLYCPPDDSACRGFRERCNEVSRFAEAEGVAVQAWAGFGMDAVVWLAGVEGAILLAMDSPPAFRSLMDIVSEADLARIRLAAETPGVDAVVVRGWYSSTDLWSPSLFDEYVGPYLRRVADAVHGHGKTFIYTMTTGVEQLGTKLADAGVDVLYFVDPVQDTITLERARDLLGSRLTLVGGINSTSLQSDSVDRIREEVCRAVETLKPTGRFILHPVDALFPDTPWDGLVAAIEAWKECR